MMHGRKTSNKKWNICLRKNLFHWLYYEQRNKEILSSVGSGNPVGSVLPSLCTIVTECKVVENCMFKSVVCAKLNILCGL